MKTIKFYIVHYTISINILLNLFSKVLSGFRFILSLRLDNQNYKGDSELSLKLGLLTRNRNKLNPLIITCCLFMLFMITILSFGCKKGWLDAKSDKSLTVPNTLSDFQGLLDNTSIMTLSYPTLGEIASDGHYVTDEVFQSMPSDFAYETDAYIWSKTTSHTKVFEDWNSTYQKILVDNVILSGLDKLKPGQLEKQQWNDIKGQALFHRARLFFELAQVYALPYNTATADQDLGIVIRSTSDVTIRSKRSTVRETYGQIVKDLNLARDLLPIRPKILTRGSASAVNAFLTRVYLSMEDYENAFTAADNCLKQYSELLDYNDVPSSANFIGLYNKEVLFHSNYSPTLLSAFSSSLIDQTLYDLYHINDLRKTRFYKSNSDGSKSFKGQYESVTYNLFNGLATDEVYLSRAECYARAGKTIDAMKDLNDLMLKRWDKNAAYHPIIASSAVEALTKVLEERKKELIFRGVRWTDLRRLNKDPRFAVTLKRTVLGIEYTLEPNSYKYTFPIPDDIIQQTWIQQNPGWP